MKSTLTFMLALGNAKMIAANCNGRETFYGRADLSPSGRKTDLNKLIACLSSKV